MTISREAFQEWLQDYGAAWEGRNPEAAAELFSHDARYYWTPFEEPKEGREAIAAAWREATFRQHDVSFSYQILAVVGATGIARWHTSLRRKTADRQVELDGILSATFSGDSLCRVFREWWHSKEEVIGE
ncbi:MAG: nuclear transport factor 2 family protein [Gemmatimonadota bacterium]